jgi:hypothetical protein
MSTPGKRRSRLSIDVEPELRRRIEIAAAARGLSVPQYVEAILRQALEADAQRQDVVEQAAWSTLPADGLARDTEQDETSIHPLTHPEQERGLRALETLERLDRELLARRSGRPFAPSRQLLVQACDERTRALLREA